MTIAEITSRDFWAALSARVTSVMIVTTLGPDGPEGFVGLSATHFSASPPLMTVAVSESTSALTPILHSGAFAINFLSDRGEPIYERFAARDAPKRSARFHGLAWHPLATGAPIFEEVVGAIDCRLEEALTRGDTRLLFGRVVGYRRLADRRPLLHFDGALYKH